MDLVNRTEIARILDLAKTTVDDYVAAGMPGQKSESGWEFDPAECIKWYKSYLQKQSENRKKGEDPSDRKTAAEAALKELQLEREQGNLVPVDWASEQVSSVLMEVKGGLLALPKSISPNLALESDPVQVEMLLREAIHDMMEAVKRTVDENS